jgi:hypothetical protein
MAGNLSKIGKKTKGLCLISIHRLYRNRTSPMGQRSLYPGNHGLSIWHWLWTVTRKRANAEKLPLTRIQELPAKKTLLADQFIGSYRWDHLLSDDLPFYPS